MSFKINNHNFSSLILLKTFRTTCNFQHWMQIGHYCQLVFYTLICTPEINPSRAISQLSSFTFSESVAPTFALENVPTYNFFFQLILPHSSKNQFPLTISNIQLYTSKTESLETLINTKR